MKLGFGFYDIDKIVSRELKQKGLLNALETAKLVHYGENIKIKKLIMPEIARFKLQPSYNRARFDSLSDRIYRVHDVTYPLEGTLSIMGPYDEILQGMLFPSKEYRDEWNKQNKEYQHMLSDSNIDHLSPPPSQYQLVIFEDGVYDSYYSNSYPSYFKPAGKDAIRKDVKLYGDHFKDSGLRKKLLPLTVTEFITTRQDNGGLYTAILVNNDIDKDIVIKTCEELQLQRDTTSLNK